MNTCPLFGICGGCKYDFTSSDYRANKLAELKDLPITGGAVWIDAGTRRRADFAFADGLFGFYQHRSKNMPKFNILWLYASVRCAVRR